MKTQLPVLAFLMSIALALLIAGDAQPFAAQSYPVSSIAPPPVPDRARLASALTSSSVMFIENVGQFAWVGAN